MPKQKTHKGLAKRVRVTRHGKVVRGRSGRRHLLSGKSRKMKRFLRGKATMTPSDAARTRRALRMTF